jgi:ferredoxin
VDESAQGTAAASLSVEVDQQICIGAGQCVLAAPGVFTQRDDDGVVELLDNHPPLSLLSQVEDAVDGCPAQAIKATRTRAGLEA